MQRPQFGLLHFFTSHVLFELNFALVRIRFRLYGWRLLLIILYFDKIFRMVSSISINI